MKQFLINSRLFLQARGFDLKKRIFGWDHVSALVVDTAQGRFCIDLRDQTVGRELSRHGAWGTGELALLERFITPASRVLIVGSHVGVIAIPVARRVQAATAIEANPRNYELLQLNIFMNRVSNLKAINVAAAEKNGSIDFILSKDNSGGSKRVPVHRKYMYYYDHPEVIEVPARRLDDELAGEQFDVVFMDIEGSEYFALQGMERLLEKVRTLFVEFVPHHLRNVSAVTPEQFAQLLGRHFPHLYIPGHGKDYQGEAITGILRTLYDRNQVEDQIIFSRVPVTPAP